MENNRIFCWSEANGRRITTAKSLDTFFVVEMGERELLFCAKKAGKSSRDTQSDFNVMCGGERERRLKNTLHCTQLIQFNPKIVFFSPHFLLFSDPNREKDKKCI